MSSHTTPEGRLMVSVEIWCGEHGHLCFRCNAGTFISSDGLRYVQGLPEGFSDLLVLRDDGVACFVETKIHPRKPTQKQMNFIAAVRSRGYRAGVAYSLEEAISIIEGKNP